MDNKVEAVTGDSKMDSKVEALTGNSKVEAVTGDSKVEAVTGDSKVEAVTGDSKVEAVTGDSKVEAVTGDSKVEAVTGDSKVEAVTGDSKVEAVTGDSKVEAVTGDSKVEAVTGDSKVEAVTGDSKEEAVSGDPKMDNKVEAVSGDPKVDNQGEAVTGDSKVEAVTGDSKVEAVSGDPKMDKKVEDVSGAPKVDNQGEAATGDSKVEAVTGDSKLEAVSGDPEMDNKVKAVIGNSKTSNKVETVSGDPKRDNKVEAVSGAPKVDNQGEAVSGDPKMDNKVEAVQKVGSGIQNERLLVEAAAHGDLPTVIALIKSGVSVDAEEHNKTLFYASKNYMTPLQMACANGHAPCAEALIMHCADVNAKDRFDVTAMHMAAEKGHCCCLKALLNANAECSLPTKYSKKGCYTAVPYLGGTTPLHLAAANNHTECVQELIQYGADYNAVDELGRTSLYIAAQFGFGECVLAHLKNAVGRDILSLPSSETHDTPLHFAVSKGMTDCVKALLRSGSDANHINLSGNSPLHLAVNPTNENEAVSMDMLKSLVIDGYKTDVNLPDYADLAPLHYVCFNGRNALRRRPEMAKFLLSYGADPDIRSTRGFSLLECELKSPSEDIEVLRYIVRSMLQPPHLSRLRVTSHLPTPSGQKEPEPSQPADMIGFVMAAVMRARANIGQEEPPMGSLHHKHLWYETMASNPRTLQHICRFSIRKALGPHNIKYIVKLPIPTAVQRYLFLERGE